MVQALERQNVAQWIDVCSIDAIAPNTGVCALVDDQQVAIFRIGQSTDVYAIANYDPFSKANVLSRGIVGDRNGIPKVASPIYKQNFNLLTGEYLDDSTVKIPIYKVRVVEERVQVAIN